MKKWRTSGHGSGRIECLAAGHWRPRVPACADELGPKLSFLYRSAVRLSSGRTLSARSAIRADRHPRRIRPRTHHRAGQRWRRAVKQIGPPCGRRASDPLVIADKLAIAQAAPLGSSCTPARPFQSCPHPDKGRLCPSLTHRQGWAEGPSRSDADAPLTERRGRRA